METKTFTLNQLIDVALESPEIGIVNFKILRTVLKVIVRELDIHDVRARVLVKDLQEAATFMKSPPKKQKEKLKKTKSATAAMVTSASSSKPQSFKQSNQTFSQLDSIEEIQEGSNEEANHLISEEQLQEITEEENDEVSEELIEEAISKKKGTNFSSSTSQSNNLESMQILERMEEESDVMSNNSVLPIQSFEELLDEDKGHILLSEGVSIISSSSDREWKDSTTDLSNYSVETHKKQKSIQSDVKTVLSDTYCTGTRWMIGNMWKTINVSKRIDAIEAGMEKIVSALNIYSRSIDRQRKDFEKKKKDDNKMAVLIEENLENLVESVNLTDGKLEMMVYKEEYLAVKNDHEDRLDEQSTKIEKLHLITEKLNRIIDGDRKLFDLFEITDSLNERLKFIEENSGFGTEEERYYDLPTIGKKFDEFVEKVQPILERLQKEEELDEGVEDVNIAEQLMNIRLNMKQMLTEFKRIKENFDVLQFDFDKQLETVDMLVKAHETGFTQEDKEEFYNMQKRLKVLEKDCEQFELLEEIQAALLVLNNNKANQSNMESALAQKADLHTVQNKVDRNEYLSAYDEINNSISEIMGKIILQEQSLVKTMETFTNELDHKVEKTEMECMTENIQSRLKALATKYKNLQYIVESEAPIPAGTKTSIAKCLSCERPLRKTPNLLFKSMPQNIIRSKVNLQTQPVVSVDQKNYVPTMECEHTGRYSGGEHTVYLADDDDRTSTFPQINTKNDKVWNRKTSQTGQIKKLPSVLD